MKIAVYLKSDIPFAQAATHSATRTLYETVVANKSGVIVKKDKALALHLTTTETWRQMKDRLRLVRSRKIPRTNAVEVGNLDLSYPEKGRETVRHPHEAMRQACIAAAQHKSLLKQEAIRLAQAPSTT